MIVASHVESSAEDWAADSVALARDAKLVLLLPSTNPGTWTEIWWLKRRGLLRKTVFVMLEDRSDRRAELADYWERMRRGLRALGVELPSYSEKGALFVLDDAGRPLKEVRWLRLYLDDTRKAVDELLRLQADAGPPGVGPEERDFVEVLEVLKRAEQASDEEPPA